MLDLREVYSVTDFLRNHKGMTAKLSESHKPIVLTVNGKPALVIQDASSYQDMLNLLDSLSAKAKIAQSEDQ